MDASDGVEHAIVDGPVPDGARRILEPALAERDATGRGNAIYDAIAEIGLALVGLRHDQIVHSRHLRIYPIETASQATSAPQATGPLDRLAPPLEAVVAAAQRVLGHRAMEAVVNSDGIVEIHLVLQLASEPQGSSEITVAQARAVGMEGDELLVPFYYLPNDEERAANQRVLGIGALLGIPLDSSAAMLRELATPA